MDEVIRDIVERELGARPTEVTEASEGLLHETYLVECGGAGYVLQFAGDESDRADSLARGLGCYVLLADSDVPVPDVVTGTLGSFDGLRYSLVERLDGTNAERDVAPGKTRAAGRVLARIHQARGFERSGWLRFEGGDPIPSAFSAGSVAGRVRERVADAGRTFERAGMTDAAQALRDGFDRRADDLSEPVDAVLCHGDFTPDNVLFAENAVTGVLDFDRARAGHATRDLVRAANAFWMHDPTADWDVRETFYDGYRTDTDYPAGFDRLEPLYRLETLAGTVAGLLELDELTDRERSFYADRLVETAERAD